MGKPMKSVIAILLTSIWVNASEFFRNEVLLLSYWVDHYRSLGMTFPNAPVNGMLWGVWGLLFSIAVFLISRKFSLVQTALLSWLVGFVLMWAVIFNLGVLPASILAYAVPLSLLESFVGAYLCVKIAPAA
jgi:hypothetical protein